MNSHALEVLEFRRLLEILGGYCQSECGRELILAQRPLTDTRQFQGRRALYDDFLKLLELPYSLPGLFVEDLNEIFVRVAPASSCLSGPELVQCRAQLTVVREVKEFLARPDVEALPELGRMNMALDGCEDLQQQLLRSLDFDGTVLDSASERLREIRREIFSLERRIQHTLEDLIHDSAYDGVLQDNFVTVRNGRYVVPVKRDARNQMNGLVHDLSNSGQTLFVEPGATLNMGNDLSLRRIEERDEIRRILAVLSGQVRNRLASFRRNQELLGQMDAAAAVSRWAGDFGCRLPAFGGSLKLCQARNPLLLSQFRREGKNRQVVPLDFSLPKNVKGIVITGSNTGGKTVILRTVGLLVMAAQCGLPVPVGEGSLFAVFDDVLADIGDEQSMEANLSTFSAHIANISQILQESGRGRCLVLLDELGSGTDPMEGGSLACGILEELAQTNSLIMATTHLGMVKNYVHTRTELLNAAVRFNRENLQPEYILDIGRPGASHALEIARRMGLPKRVMSKAQSLMSGEHLQLENVLSEMENQQHRLTAMAAEAEKARIESQNTRDELERQLKDFRRQRQEKLTAAYAEAENVVLEARREVEGLLRNIRENASRAVPSGKPENVDESVKKAREVIAARLQEYQLAARDNAPKSTAVPAGASDLQVGKKIWIEKLSAHGRIESFSDRGRKIQVLVNGVSFTISRNEVSRRTEDDEKKESSKPVVKVVQARVTGNTCHEINLVGLRVEDALLRLEPYIQECLLARLDEVRVIHGFGTGRLRNGIHEWLRRQPYVREFHLGRDYADPGGGGATIVKFK